MDYSLPGFPEFTVPWSLLKFMSIESWMLSNHLLLCCPPFLLPSVFPSIKVFSLQVAKVLELSASVLPMHIQSCFPLGWTCLVSFPGGSVVKNPPVKQEIRVWSLSQEDAWEKWQPTPIFFPGKSHWQRSLVGYSPWGRKRVRHNSVTKHYHHLFEPSRSGAVSDWSYKWNQVRLFEWWSKVWISRSKPPVDLLWMYYGTQSEDYMWDLIRWKSCDQPR